jgi:hypothetical protein
MPTPTWPFAFNFEVGLSASLPDTVLRTQMDAGPAKVRRRFTAGVEPTRASVLLTKAESATFRTWFRDTLLDGSLAFEHTHPLTAATATFRFTAPPQYRMESQRGISWELPLEVLP